MAAAGLLLEPARELVAELLQHGRAQQPQFRSKAPVPAVPGLRAFDQDAARLAREQRQAALLASIDRAKRVAHAKWQAERPSVLAELKSSRPPADAVEGAAQPGSGARPWQAPPPAHPAEPGTAAPDVSRLHTEMQQMRTYMHTLEARLASTGGAGAPSSLADNQGSGPARPTRRDAAGSRAAGSSAAAAPLQPKLRSPTPERGSAARLAPVSEECAGEVESPISDNMS